MLKENVLWYVTCEFTDKESGPGAEIILFKAKNQNEAIDYLSAFDIDKELSEYKDKIIKIFKYVERACI